MTPEEIIDALLGGNASIRDEAIARLTEGDKARSTMERCKKAFAFVDSGDYAALGMIRSYVEEL